MNVEEVEKDLMDQLTSLQLSGLRQINRMEQEHREQLESLEEKHKKEMKRLMGQEAELYQARKNFERERRRMVERNEDELKETKKRNREEEEKKKKENRELSRRNLEEDSRLNRLLQDQSREMLNQNQRAYNSVQDQERIREFQQTLMIIDKKWKGMKDVFNSVVRYGIENNDEEERKDVLEGIRKMKESRTELTEQLMSMSRDLGRLREAVREEDYERTETNLTAFQQKQNALVAALEKGKTSIIRNKIPCWEETDMIVTECSESLNQLLGNRISLRSEPLIRLSDF